MASGDRSQARQGLGLIAPPLGYAVLVMAAPLLTIVAYSFLTDGYLTVIREFTLANYRAVWSDPIFHKIMLRSLGVAARPRASHDPAPDVRAGASVPASPRSGRNRPARARPHRR